MIPEEIDKMEAGREMDIIIAETIFGWVFYINKTASCPWVQWQSPRGGEHEVPHYSTDLSAAREVVEKLYSRFDIFITHHASMEGWEVVLENKECGEIQAEAPDLSLAICQAALKVTIK